MVPKVHARGEGKGMMICGAVLSTILETFLRSRRKHRCRRLRSTSLTSTLHHAFSCLVCCRHLKMICVNQLLPASEPSWLRTQLHPQRYLVQVLLVLSVVVVVLHVHRVPALPAPAAPALPAPAALVRNRREHDPYGCESLGTDD